MQRDPESFVLTTCATKGKQANITNLNLWRWNHEHRKYHQFKKKVCRTPDRKNYRLSRTGIGDNRRVKTFRNLEKKIWKWKAQLLDAFFFFLSKLGGNSKSEKLERNLEDFRGKRCTAEAQRWMAHREQFCTHNSTLYVYVSM